jgi:hypothetical protein
MLWDKEKEGLSSTPLMPVYRLGRASITPRPGIGEGSREHSLKDVRDPDGLIITPGFRAAEFRGQSSLFDHHLRRCTRLRPHFETKIARDAR